MNPRHEAALARLHDTYCTCPQIGLVLGAGVTIDSGVRGYLALALHVHRLAVEQRLLRDPLPYLADEGVSHDAAEADEIFEYLGGSLAGGAEALSRLVREALYGNRFPSRTYKTVPRETYGKNATLDAVITLCAARPGAPHAGPPVSTRIAANRRVGAILTTNYDNLVEGSFGTKYGKSGVLRPVGRLPARDVAGAIPVYHCHGYVSYTAPEGEGSELLIAQHDYFAAFYDQLGFGNLVATSFLRRWPSLFIGSSMVDRNIRRVLFQTRAERVDAVNALEHFALLKRSGPRDELEDAVLSAYGVSAIRIDEFDQIPGILRDLYLAPDDVDDEEWAWARAPTRRPAAPTHA